MTTKVHEGYLKRVAAALKETGHPRRSEVLDDLREHLEAIARESAEPIALEQLIERFGTPEEYAESLAPAEGARRKPWHQRRRVRFAVFAAAALVLFILAGSLTFFPDRYSLKAHFREATGRNFSAPSPFFDLETALALDPGTEGQAIRDAIGYPFKRYRGTTEEGKRYAPGADWYQNTANENEVIWEYTSPVEAESPFYTVCNVITDAAERLIRVDSFRAHVSYNVRDKVFRYPTFFEGKSAYFERPEETKLILRPSEPGVYVITNLTVPHGDSIQEKLAERQAEVNAALDGIPLDQLHFVYEVGTGADPYVGLGGPYTDAYEEFRRDLAKLPADAPVYNVTARQFVGSAWLGAITIYHRGTLYALPIPVSETSPLANATRRDTQWLLRKLLAE